MGGVLINYYIVLTVICLEICVSMCNKLLKQKKNRTGRQYEKKVREVIKMLDV